MDGWSEKEQEIEMDVCRDKRLRYTVISLLVLSDLSAVVEHRKLNQRAACYNNSVTTVVFVATNPTLCCCQSKTDADLTTTNFALT